MREFWRDMLGFVSWFSLLVSIGCFFSIAAFAKQWENLVATAKMLAIFGPLLWFTKSHMKNSYVWNRLKYIVEVLS